MKILIEIAQQTDVHFFKNIIWGLEQKGHKILIVARDRELTHSLLDEYKLPYKSISKIIPGRLGLLRELFIRTTRICALAREFQPDIFLGRTYSYILSSRLTRKPCLFDTDDGRVVGWLNYNIMKLADIICTPDSLGDQFGDKQISYPGYKELAYLHPDHFHPDPAVIKEAGVEKGEKYVILRFSAYEAFHDVGKRGIDLQSKLKMVRILESFGRVFITSENELDERLNKYQINVNPGKIHSLIYFADLYAGDSQTMASEAAVLGTPSVRCSPWVGKSLNLEELEHRYGLTFGFPVNQMEEFIAKIQELLRQTGLKQLWRRKRDKMLSERINVAEFFINLIDGFSQGLTKKQIISKYRSAFKQGKMKEVAHLPFISS